jgi:squalene-hopene/tetraprenyl-beta-curcumene cyclase
LLWQIDKAIEKGLGYLREHQRDDGAWLSLSFGNQDNPNGENPVWGTSRVLIALADLGYQDSDLARRGVEWLCRVQHDSGGFGPIVSRLPQRAVQTLSKEGPDTAFNGPSIEETALAVTALLRIGAASDSERRTVERGLAWLIEGINNGRHLSPAPIGLYFARFWYYERLYPIIFATGALQAAAAAMASAERTDSHHQPTPLQFTSW